MFKFANFISTRISHCAIVDELFYIANSSLVQLYLKLTKSSWEIFVLVQSSISEPNTGVIETCITLTFGSVSFIIQRKILLS